MGRTFAALLVDSDLKGLESLVYGFQGADWRITACPAPETAGLLVKASGADVVVLASREPHEKTLVLVRQLRSQDETRTLPLLVLGPEGLRGRLAESGNVEFLATPVFVRDAISASRIAIAVARDADPKIEGSLPELSLLSLLRSMSALARSGVLQVERAGRRGEILFSEGELTGAQLGALQGSAALHHLLMWEDGKIDLQLRTVGRRAPVTQRFDQVIEEGERFLRDYSHAIAGLGCSSTIYDRNEAKVAGSAQSYPSEVMPLVRLCDGKRTLADLIDQSPFRVFDTIRILARLVDLGAITRRKSADVGSRSDQDLEKFWETARIASPDDALAPARPASRVSATHDARVGEPSRRKLQRRARAETPVLGTPLSELVEAKAPATQSQAAAQTTSDDASRGKERTSGVLQVPAGERRQPKHDRRERPSVTIDVELVEAAMQAPTPPPVAVPAAALKPALTPAAGRPIVGMLGKPALTPAAGGPIVGASRKPALTPAAGRPIVGMLGKPALTPAAGGPIVGASGKLADVKDPFSSAVPVPVANDASASLAPRTARITGTLQVTPSGHRRTGQVPIVGASVAVDPTLTGAVDAEMAAAPPTPPPSVVFEKDQAAKTGEVAPSKQPGPPNDASRGARVTGTLSISPSQRTTLPKKTPSRGISVQLDPVLVAELDRLEKATAPGGPSPTSDIPTVPIKSGASRMTGTLSTPSSLRPAKKPLATPGVGVSVALDPTLAQDTQNPTSPEAVAGNTAAADHAGGATKRPSQPRPAEADGSRAGARISGAFNAVESDFFAREADLYKREGEDSFADLDEPGNRSGSGAKGTPRRNNRR